MNDLSPLEFCEEQKDDFDFRPLYEVKKNGVYIARFADGKNDRLTWLLLLENKWYYATCMLIPVIEHEKFTVMNMDGMDKEQF